MFLPFVSECLFVFLSFSARVGNSTREMYSIESAPGIYGPFRNPGQYKVSVVRDLSFFSIQYLVSVSVSESARQLLLSVTECQISL
jgi:hypothetical protein